jgi:hypothetical protein
MVEMSSPVQSRPTVPNLLTASRRERGGEMETYSCYSCGHVEEEHKPGRGECEIEGCSCPCFEQP